MSDWTLHMGDCAAGLAAMPADSVDALVTDPPAGIGFMGREWDSDKGGRVSWIAWLEGVMREALRVMKPGAHGLVWALPRTSHWTATALEQAGFEVRDVITHHFGTGFPKSLNISKAIDEAAGAERAVVGSKLGRPGYSLAHQGAGGTLAGRADGSLDNSEGECAITAPATDAAKQWDGWGTALKPASEMWLLVRKPMRALDFIARPGVDAAAGGRRARRTRRRVGRNEQPASRRRPNLERARQHPPDGKERRADDLDDPPRHATRRPGARPVRRQWIDGRRGAARWVPVHRVGTRPGLPPCGVSAYRRGKGRSAVRAGGGGDTMTPLAERQRDRGHEVMIEERQRGLFG